MPIKHNGLHGTELNNIPPSRRSTIYKPSALHFRTFDLELLHRVLISLHLRGVLLSVLGVS